MRFDLVYLMYQAFARLDNYNMMIRLIKMKRGYVKSYVISKVLWLKVN
jgi:hypothetical protein